MTPGLPDGFQVGHWTDEQAATGCTVILCPPRTLGAVEVRGAAPGTRETDLLGPGNLVDEVHAVLLSGGSAFGLDAAAGVMEFLEQRGIGFDAGAARVPIVPGAVIFDLAVGSPVRPGRHGGMAACDDAESFVTEGNVGVGTGATVGKYRGMARAMMGGFAASATVTAGMTVIALAVTNALGDVLAPDGRILAGARDVSGFPTGLWPEASPDVQPGTNTTLVVVITNGRYQREQLQRLAVAAHDGIARAIFPAHTMYDGDTVFCLARGSVEPAPSLLAAAAVTEMVAAAIRRSVIEARGRAGLPAVRDLAGNGEGR